MVAGSAQVNNECITRVSGGWVLIIDFYVYFFYLSVLLSDFYQIYLLVILMTVLISGIWKLTVADPDLQIRGGEVGGVHLDPEIREGPRSQKLGGGGSKNKGAGEPLPWIRHSLTVVVIIQFLTMLNYNTQNLKTLPLA